MTPPSFGQNKRTDFSFTANASNGTTTSKGGSFLSTTYSPEMECGCRPSATLRKKNRGVYLQGLACAMEPPMKSGQLQLFVRQKKREPECDQSSCDADRPKSAGTPVAKEQPVENEQCWRAFRLRPSRRGGIVEARTRTTRKNSLRSSSGLPISSSRYSPAGLGKRRVREYPNGEGEERRQRDR